MDLRPSITLARACLILLAAPAFGSGALAERRGLGGMDRPANRATLPAARLAQSNAPGGEAPIDTKPEAKPDGKSPPAAQPADTKPADAKPADAKPADTKTTEPKAATKTPGTEATVVNLKTIEGVMGKSVRSRDKNEDMGRIVDVLVDGGGQIRAAVIDFGGFLGVGSRKVAVAWKTLDFADSIKSGSVKVTLTRDQVRQSPEYKPDEPIVILEGAPTAKPAGVAPPPGHIQDAPPR